MKNKTAFIFPAFITDFTGKELSFLESNALNINDYLNIVSKVINLNLPEFTYNSDVYNEELKSQLLAFSFSCAFADILKVKDIKADYVAGYSMGIYASLYATGSISFTEGCKLIYKAYDLVKEIAQQKIYGMAAIIGLTCSDVDDIIKSNSFNLEIINVNNEHSLVIAGKKPDIKEFLTKAIEEGALSAIELTVNTPYHSKYLLEYSESFNDFIQQIEIKDPQIPVISTYDQREINKADELRSELVLNLTKKINWFNTMKKLVENGVVEIYECGAGKDLKKISRFINGDYKIKSVYKI